MPEDLQIHLLGGLQISKNGTPVAGFISSKVPALLAYLAINCRAYSREVLASLLWGEMSEEDAKNNLRQALSNLRKHFEPHLIITREVVQFNPDIPFFLDVECFTNALQARDFHKAVSVYRGDFLEGFYVREAPNFEEWVFAQQARLREHALQALHGLMIEHARRGEYDQAIDSANRLLALDPWREEAHRHLMLMQARSGQRSAALAQYQVCRSILRKEFDTDPSTETTTLYTRIQESMRSARHNLPAAVTGFVGRETELAELRRLLASPENRLLTILGPGGVGKTRLALEVAATCEAMFLNGVWFVPLGSEQPDGFEYLILALADALGFVLSSPNEPSREMIAFLRQKEMLLVLDNLEEYEGAIGWLVELLVQAPHIKILAISRQRLNLQAEQIYFLGGLPAPPDPSSGPESSAAWQLFLQRARRVQVDFSPDEIDALAIGRICRLVEGMPLAIELAAAWVSQLTCREIADQIEGNLDFLKASQRDISPRHSSLRGVFDWSWNQLTAAEQNVFQGLSVFSGPFSREAAAHVSGATPVILASLVDKSLAWRRGGIFQLHEVARQFGAEKLKQAGDQEQAQNRHARYYAQFLANRSDGMQGTDQQKALIEIEKEFENICSAWYWLIAKGEVSQIAVAIDGLYHFSAIRSRFRPALELFGAARLALQPLAMTDPRALLAYCRVTAREGRFLSFLSRFEEANQRLVECLGRLQELDEPDEMAFVLGHLGGTARMQGNLSQAEQWLRQCLDLRQQTGNLPGQAVAFLELGGVAFMGADYESAREACQRGFAIAEKIGDLQTTAHLLTGLSLCFRELGQHQAALAYCYRSQEIYQALGDRYGVIQASLTLGELNRQLGTYEEARHFCQQAIQVSQEICHASGEADGHYRLGQIARTEGDLALAQAHQILALKQAAAIHETPLVWDALLEVGATLAQTESCSKASVILTWLQCQPEVGSVRFDAIANLLSPLPAETVSAGLQTARSLSQEDIFNFCINLSP